jgi:ssDNA-binding Zn-finger/Zn-ribbon topoisomerase 1
MALQVTCQCGQRFAAKDEMAGRTVRCPKCKEPLTIPASPPTRSAAPEKITVNCQCGQRFSAKTDLAGKTVRCPKCKQPLQVPGARSKPSATEDQQSTPELFDVVDYESNAAALDTCPECGAILSSEQVVCIQCGYNKQLGQRMKTKKPAPANKQSGLTSHRGVPILVLSIFGLCCFGISGVAALYMAEEDLEEMEKGRMRTDNGGKVMTQIGWYLGLGGLILWLIGFFLRVVAVTLDL